MMHQQERAQEAAEWYRKALALDPTSLATYDQLSALFKDRHDYEASATVLAQALVHFPDNVALHMRYCYVLIMTGRLAEGWAEYEWRWRLKESTGRRHMQVSEWRGEDLRGRTILLYPEQGLGDTLQFIRYASLMGQAGANVIVECQRELKSLLLRTPGIAAVRAVGEPLPAFDFQLPLMSAPRVYGTTGAPLPANVPYLFADATKVKTWANRLTRDDPSSSAAAPKSVGLVWAGSAKNPGDRIRSLPLSAFAPLAKVPNIRWYNLQFGPASKQPPPPGLVLIDHSRLLGPFEETAALVANLDLVIAVDTAVVHLAGAMNRPVWVLIPDPCDWRWLAERRDSPWYPSMRLFRQRLAGDWNPVLEQLAAELTGWATT